VITANHVSAGAFRLSDGRVFDVSVGSDLRLRNAGLPAPFANPDLRMFRLAADPGLPALAVTESAPEVNAQVTMIGAGVDRSSELLGWQVSVVTGGLQWTPSQPIDASHLGYGLLTSSKMRWGVNLVASEVAFATDQTFSFTTRFDQQGMPFEAQATLGDSGGGVFQHAGGAWKLVGIMTSNQLLNNQPAGTVVFGDQTVIADLASYREEILGLVTRVEPLWQNQVNHFDVNGSGNISARDALLIINELLDEGPRALTGSPSDAFLDVNGDYNLAASDALAVINRLLGNNPSATASAASVNFVPEPSSAALAAGAALSAALASYLRPPTCRLRRRPRPRASWRESPGRT
jgi:hypothetical protein